MSRIMYECGCVEMDGDMVYCDDHKYHKHITAGEKALAEARKERDQLRADLERERMEFMAREMALCKEVERLRALCVEAAKTMRSSTHMDNCDCGCIHEAELHGRLVAAGRGEGGGGDELRHCDAFGAPRQRGER